MDIEEPPVVGKTDILVCPNDCATLTKTGKRIFLIQAKEIYFFNPFINGLEKSYFLSFNVTERVQSAISMLKSLRRGLNTELRLVGEFIIILVNLLQT